MKWWGEHLFELGQVMSWSFGSLTLTIMRLKKEWQVSYTHLLVNQDQEYTQVEFNSRAQSMLCESKVLRFAFKETEPSLYISLHLPDRPLVARPLKPLMIPAKEMATLYTSAAFWLGLCVGVDQKKLIEIPVREYSDTWFGPNTISGELCYASKTNAYLLHEELAQKPHRAIIPVSIQNEGNQTLKIERMNIPVCFLNLYQAFDEHFYAESLLFVRESNSNAVKVDIEKKGTLHQIHRLVTPSRKKKDENFLFKTIEMLFA